MSHVPTQPPADRPSDFCSVDEWVAFWAARLGPATPEQHAAANAALGLTTRDNARPTKEQCVAEFWAVIEQAHANASRRRRQRAGEITPTDRR